MTIPEGRKDTSWLRRAKERLIDPDERKKPKEECKKDRNERKARRDKEMCKAS
jgi:hypothetical protein